MDVYKEARVSFTIQNLTRFHSCTAANDRDQRLDKHQSLIFLSAKAEEYKNGGGWRLLVVLRKTLVDNSISIKKKVAAWRREQVVITICPAGGAVRRVRIDQCSLHRSDAHPC